MNEYVHAITSAFIHVTVMSLIIWLHLDAVKSVAITPFENDRDVVLQYKDDTLKAIRAGDRRLGEERHRAMQLYLGRPHQTAFGMYSKTIGLMVIPLAYTLFVFLHVLSIRSP
jgi:hypothetical protein